MTARRVGVAAVVTTRPVPLSVLDLAPVSAGTDVPQALAAAKDVARHVERLGYQRMWVAEHHGMTGIASSAPAVLIGALADATTTLRVGSGGVMLPNHAPLVVAEQFGTLAALHPGRIDLGLGRAPGTDPVTAAALRRSTDPTLGDDFPRQLAELRGYLDDGRGPGGVTAVPGAGSGVPVWLLGSSGFSAQLAGLLGLPFAFAHHFSAGSTAPALDLYRSSFRPSTVLDEPYAMVCVSVTAADTDEQARYVAAPAALSFLRLRTLGRPGLLPTPEEAAGYPYSPLERAFVEERQADQVIGSVATVRAGLEELVARTGADELMVTTIVHGHEDRLRSFALVAEAAGLPTAVAA